MINLLIPFIFIFEQQFWLVLSVLTTIFITSKPRVDVNALSLTLLMAIILVALYINESSSGVPDVRPYGRFFLFTIAALMLRWIIINQAINLRLIVIVFITMLFKSSLILIGENTHINVCEMTNCIENPNSGSTRYANVYDISAAAFFALLGGAYLAVIPVIYFFVQTRLSILVAAVVLIQGMSRRTILLSGAMFVVFWTILSSASTGLEEKKIRLIDFNDSSMNDKYQQYFAVANNTDIGHLLIGDGLSAQLPGIGIRDESRPYGYEAQLPALIFQGGVVLLIALIGFVLITTRSWIAVAIYVLAGTVNPLSFSLTLYVTLLLLAHYFKRQRYRT